MEEPKQSDSIVIHDGAERRRFMRRGAAFVAAAGVVGISSGRSALASDCDRGGSGEEKPEHAGNGSDSDTGAGSDPAGCGRNYQEPPKISKVDDQGVVPGSTRSISVAKILG